MGFFGDLFNGLTGGILGGVGSVASSILQYPSALISAPLNNYYRHQQQDDSKDLMAYQSQLNQQNWHDQFSTIAQYNEPSAVAKRYLDAGISPSAAFGGSAVGQSGASPSVAPVTPVLPNNGLNVSSLAQMTALLSAARKDSAQASEITSLLHGKVVSQDLQNEFQELQNIVAHDTLPKRAQLELKKLLSDCLDLQASAGLKGAQELLSDEQRLKTIAERLLAITDNEQAKVVLGRITDLIDAKIKSAYAAAARDTSQASLNTALRATEDALRSGRVTAQEIGNKLLDVQHMMAFRSNEIQETVKYDEISRLCAEAKRAGLINQLTEQEIVRAAKANDWYEVQQLLGIVGTTISGFNAATSRLDALNGSQRNEIMSRNQQAVERHLNRSHHTRRVFDADGNLQGWYNDSSY